MVAYSRPKFPLGMVGATANGKPILYSEEPAIECAICCCKTTYNKFIELSCSHVFCTGCMLKHAATCVTHERRINCPLCRSYDCHVKARFSASAGTVDGIPTEGYHLLYAVTDVWENWQTVAVVHEQTGELFVNRLLCRKHTPKLSNFPRCKLTWISPYSGWFCPTDQPKRNPSFAVVERGLETIIPLPG